MRKKQEEFYKIYHKLGRTGEAAEVALGEVYSIKTWSKAKKKEQLDKLFSSNEGKLYLESLEKTKKVRKKLEKTASNKVEKKKRITSNKYDKQFDSIAKEILALGGHDLDVQAAIGISTATYYRWKIEYPSFLVAIRAGRDFYSVEQVEAGLIRRARGGHILREVITKEDAEGNIIERITKEREQDAETNAAKTVVFNRSPERWHDKPEPKTNEKPIEIKLVVEKVAPDEIPTEYLDDD